MDHVLRYQLLADAVLVLHTAIVCFIVGGLALIITGNMLGWLWVNALWFRLVHLLAILMVVAETWIGIACPLTILEVWLRSKTGVDTYAGGFIEYWLQRLLYYEAPAWAFTLVYSLFGLAVIAAWWCYPPHLRKSP